MNVNNTKIPFLGIKLPYRLPAKTGFYVDYQDERTKIILTNPHHILAYEEGERLVRHIPAVKELLVEGPAELQGYRFNHPLTIEDFIYDRWPVFSYSANSPSCVWMFDKPEAYPGALRVEHSPTNPLEINITYEHILDISPTQTEDLNYPHALGILPVVPFTELLAIATTRNTRPEVLIQGEDTLCFLLKGTYALSSSRINTERLAIAKTINRLEAYIAEHFTEQDDTGDY